MLTFCSLNSTEVVVEGDLAYAHPSSDIFNGSAQQKRTLLIETPHRNLLLGTVQVGQAAAQLTLHRLDEPLEGTVELRQTQVGDGIALPFDWLIARPGGSLRHQACAE